MNPVQLIAKKRDGQPHSAEELEFIANSAANGSIPDYQLSAWLMAAFLNPLSPTETAYLTLAMAKSGERLCLQGLPKPWVDKHSTGGVGDKTTLVVLPLLASCGLTMVKMSGRGLGITGGTIDKLESIPGFRTDLAPSEMVAQAQKIGIALTGQTPNLAPADKVLYSLRDVTATVPSLPLIVSSILSKKIAGGAESVILDVKCGSGAFMKTLEEASQLAYSLVEVGTQAGLNVKAIISDMDQPLGTSAGNALEVKEAIRVLRGETGRFSDLCLHLAGSALTLAGKENGKDLARQAIQSGAALEKAKQWVSAQGGDLTIFDHENWQTANHVVEVFPQEPNGFVEKIDTEAIGQLVVDLGGGRKSKTDPIDHTVGIETLITVGDQLQSEKPVFRVHSNTPTASQLAVSILQSAITVSKDPVRPNPVILK